MSSPAPSSAALVQAARRRDQTAWKHLVERYDGMIRDICRSHPLRRSEVDDVRQTTWLRAVEHLDRIHDPQKIGAWLARVARNECLRLLQQGARVQLTDAEVFDSMPDQRQAPDERALALEQRRVVRSVVATLPTRERNLLSMLYHHSEPSYSDIGSALSMPVGSIGPTRGRALERLRRSDRIAELVAVA